MKRFLLVLAIVASCSLLSQGDSGGCYRTETYTEWEWVLVNGYLPWYTQVTKTRRVAVPCNSDPIDQYD